MRQIDRESPTGADLALLMARHTQAMHADTPPESIHMMDATALDSPNIHFFVLRDQGQPVGMGAFKIMNAHEGEIKSMHILHEVRGQGMAKQMLMHLIEHAKAAGLTRLSLETGAQSSFEAARLLYEKAGFCICMPFGAYVSDPNSVFMTKAL
ncbi:MAG: GNAT family N-acetyltransferase [Paracoccaceae bacterium]|jgi:putative acetyltransferase|nr:GNAT family N-acetyltransferase [Paracoccaceae bacterium]